MATTHTRTVTNTAKGIRGLYSIDGLVNLAPGETREIEMTAAEIKSAESTGHFDFGGAKTPEPEIEQPEGDGLDDLKVAELDKIITAEKVTVGETGSGKVVKADKIAAIRVAREAAAAPQGDALDDMDDAELRTTVQALTGEEPPADADRAMLLALARGETQG